jgi:hypothetical protein
VLVLEVHQIPFLHLHEEEDLCIFIIIPDRAGIEEPAPQKKLWVLEILEVLEKDCSHLELTWIGCICI